MTDMIDTHDGWTDIMDGCNIRDRHDRCDTDRLTDMTDMTGMKNNKSGAECSAKGDSHP